MKKRRSQKRELIVISDMTEFEAHKRSTRRRLWIIIGFQFTVTLIALFIGFVGISRPPAVIVYDKGMPVLFTETSMPRMILTDIRVEYFVKEYLEIFAGVDSANVAEDATKALNMMTPRFRMLMKKNEKFMSLGRLKYPKSNMKTRIRDSQVLIGKYDPKKLDGQIKVAVTGRLDFDYKFSEEDLSISFAGPKDQKPKQKWIIAHLVLQRVPVTAKTIHGLQVESSQVDYFKTKDDFDNKLRLLRRI